MSLGKVRIFACGGCGINAAHGWDQKIQDSLREVAGRGVIGELAVTYVDTSESNLNGSENKEQVFLLAGVDGSGKVRASNHEEIGKIIKPLLLEHPAEQLNIVVFSASGGSGSVIGPLVMRELLQRGERTIGIVVGSSESVISINNTNNTLKSLDNIARKNGQPVVIAFEHNESTADRPEVDARIRATIGSLLIMAGPHIRELDTEDVTNWLQYHKVSKITPQLSLLDIVVDTTTLPEDIADPISIASIINTPEQALRGVTPDYITEGYQTKTDNTEGYYHYVITIDPIPRIAQKMAEAKARVDERTAARKKQDTIVRGDDHATDDDMII
jgi:hypothetical protein